MPVWLALQLHKRNKARILLPEWLSSKQLSGGVVTFMQWWPMSETVMFILQQHYGMQPDILGLNWMVPARYCLSAGASLAV